MEHFLQNLISSSYGHIVVNLLENGNVEYTEKQKVIFFTNQAGVYCKPRWVFKGSLRCRRIS